MINKIRSMVKSQNYLIHCITNPISINQCANVILSSGARPIMAEHPKEVREITAASNALMLNMGNITDARMESMLISAETAKKKDIPIMLDVVGIACSKLRRSFGENLLKKITPTVIKGNYSEIYALYSKEYSASGVDGDKTLREDIIKMAAISLAKKYNTIILASGEVDIVTDGKRLVRIKNGTKQLSYVTGTGCMLGALCATYLPVQSDIEAVIAACVVLGICGELAETDKGYGSFMINLLDALSTIRDVDIDKYSDMEEMKIEKL